MPEGFLVVTILIAALLCQRASSVDLSVWTAATASFLFVFLKI